MKGSRLTEEQNIGILKEIETGTKTVDALSDGASGRGNQMLAKVQMDLGMIKAMVAVNVALSIIILVFS